MNANEINTKWKSISVSTTPPPERVTQNRVIERITRPMAQGGLC
jgi:hypothetical protein